MTCALDPHADLTAKSACAPSLTSSFPAEQRAWSETDDLTADPLGHAKLNAEGIRNLHMLHVLERVAVAFNDAGIPLLVMKGAALHLALYTELNQRPMGDLDLLIHSEDLAKASNLLESLGAARGEPLVQEDFCPRFHYEIEFSLGTIYPVKIDLHVRPFRPVRYSRLVPPDALWARARCVRFGRASILLPSVEDMLVHLAAHAAIHGCSRRMWLRDIGLWIAAHQSDIDWNRLLATVEDWRLALPVREGLSCASGEIGAVCPEHVVSRLARMRVTWRDRLALWQSPRDADHPAAHVFANVACTPGLRFSLTYLLAVMIPSRRHLDDWYGPRHWAWLPCAQLLRWVRPAFSWIPRPRFWSRNSRVESVGRLAEVAECRC